MALRKRTKEHSTQSCKLYHQGFGSTPLIAPYCRIHYTSNKALAAQATLQGGNCNKSYKYLRHIGKFHIGRTLYSQEVSTVALIMCHQNAFWN